MSRVFKGCRVLMTAAKTTAATTAAAAAAPAAKRPNGILKVVPLSPAMRKFFGVPEASRTDTVKIIWKYIKMNNLQNHADKRKIFCSEKLKSIFDGKDKVGFLEMAKLLSGHFVKSS